MKVGGHIKDYEALWGKPLDAYLALALLIGICVRDLWERLE